MLAVSYVCFYLLWIRLAELSTRCIVRVHWKHNWWRQTPGLHPCATIWSILCNHAWLPAVVGTGGVQIQYHGVGCCFENLCFCSSQPSMCERYLIFPVLISQVCGFCPCVCPVTDMKIQNQSVNTPYRAHNMSILWSWLNRPHVLIYSNLSLEPHPNQNYHAMITLW